MNQIISRLGAAAVAVPVFLFAVCLILPAGYIMMAARLRHESAPDRRVAANIGLISNYDLPGWRHFGGER